jgi:hypothetical protein
LLRELLAHPLAHFVPGSPLGLAVDHSARPPYDLGEPRLAEGMSVGVGLLVQALQEDGSEFSPVAADRERARPGSALARTRQPERD